MPALQSKALGPSSAPKSDKSDFGGIVDGCGLCYQAAPPSPYYPKDQTATWRSGYAADCKSVYPGSIPGVASNSLILLYYHRTKMRFYPYFPESATEK